MSCTYIFAFWSHVAEHRQNFQPSNISCLPARAKAQVVADWKYIVTTEKDMIQAGTAAANIAMAYGTGYGVDCEFEAHQQWLRKSIDLGCSQASFLQMSWNNRNRLSEQSVDGATPTRKSHFDCLFEIYRLKAAIEIVGICTLCWLAGMIRWSRQRMGLCHYIMPSCLSIHVPTYKC
jgi:hypothetical protein